MSLTNGDGTLLKPVKKVIHGIEDDLNVMMIK